MSKSMYVGVEGKARKVKRMYVGVDGVARKIKKAYVGIGGVARQVYSAETVIQYTGKMTTQDITDADGTPCILYTLTSSGTLTLEGGPVRAWCCGGGGNGGDTDYTPEAAGGGGGGYVASGELVDGVYAVTIGSRGGTTNMGDALTANGGNDGRGSIYGNGGDGGSGGGGGWSSLDASCYGGTGAHITTIPFGITDLKRHCAGGGGGTNYDISQRNDAGSGGSNGDNGRGYVNYSNNGGKGGEVGGGQGRVPNSSAYSASFYGSGGGGAGGGSVDFPNKGGVGYQGVAYLLVEK